MLDDVFQKRNVGLHPADAEFRERPVRALHRVLVGVRAGDELDEQRIVERRDERVAVAHAAVKPDAEAAGGAIRENPAVVRHEFIFRVFRGDPALNRVAVAGNFILRRHPDHRPVQFVPLGDQNLRAHQVEAGDDFGDGVLDLDARVHLDEEPFVLVEVVEKLNRAGVVVTDLLRHPGGGVAQFVDNFLGQAETWRHLDDLLMAALHRAIALVQMDHVAVLVAENLHLDVLGVRNIFFEEHRWIAEGAFGFRLRFVQQTRKVGSFLHHAHAASAAAEGGLDDEREADLLCGLHRLLAVGNGFFVAGQNRDVDFLCERAGGGFVAHHVEQLRPRPDERDAGFGARAGEVRVLGKKAVTWMNRVHAFFLGDGNDALDVEIRGDRSLVLADEIRLVRLESVQAEAVGLRVDGDGAQIQFRARAENADGNLATVGSEEFFKGTDRILVSHISSLILPG